MLIAVIGGSECSRQEAQMAEDVGRELAQRGVGLICGGLGGVMEAASRGAALAGGRTVGILPGHSPKEANQYVEIPIVTGMSYARNVIVVKSAEAVIAVGGSYGTLSEIAHALQNGIPVVGLNTWSLYRGRRKDNSIILANTSAQAVDRAMNAARLRAKQRSVSSPGSEGDSGQAKSGGRIAHY